MCQSESQSGRVERDRELMTAFYGCSSAAFEELSEHWLPRLRGFFRAQGLGAEDAEDFSLDVLVRLFTTKEQRTFDVDRPLQPFLFTIARRLAIAEFRRGHEETVSLDDALHLAAEEDGERAQFMADLLCCVRELPEAEKTYMCLCERHGLGELSHNDIAAVLGKWPAQITQLSKRARAAVKDGLARKGY